ncbi:MAG: hypothetical protein AB7O65_13615 [Candidatus Korobacteraceae bacterium]
MALLLKSKAERLACAALCVAGSLALAHQTWSVAGPANKAEVGEISTAYLNGRTVSFQLAPVPRGGPTFEIGPWRFGERVLYPTPRDRRLNLYLVVPGTQHRVPGYEAYDHNDVINSMPSDGRMMEWDVYWAVVLDPSLKQEFQAESELLLATQKEFHPSESFVFDDIPSAGFLRDIVKIGALPALEKHRRASGNLPQVLIVPADFAVRASVRELGDEDAAEVH